jgi:hypothetical protein
MYGDPRHLTTSVIWNHVHYFVSQNSNLPMLCMGNLNDIVTSRMFDCANNINYMN